MALGTRFAAFGLVAAIASASHSHFSGKFVSFERCETVESFDRNERTGRFERQVTPVVSFSAYRDCRGDPGLSLGFYQAGAADFLAAVAPLVRERLADQCAFRCAGNCDRAPDSAACHRCTSDCLKDLASLEDRLRGSVSCGLVDDLMALDPGLDATCLSCGSSSCARLESAAASCASGKCHASRGFLKDQRRLEEDLILATSAGEPDELNASTPSDVPSSSPTLATALPTATANASPTVLGGVTNCGCDGCTSAVLDRGTDANNTGFTCRERMDYLVQQMRLDETAACRQVSGEFPSICGEDCNPDTCVRLEVMPSPSPGNAPSSVSPRVEVTCGCPSSCDATALAQVAGPEFGGNYSCFDRINWLMASGGVDETTACWQVSSEFPDICGLYCNPSTCNGTDDDGNGGGAAFGIDCGCAECDGAALGAVATGPEGAYSCGARILWLMENYGMAELAACERVGLEFPDVCGANCSRATCTRLDVPTPAPHAPEELVDCGCAASCTTAALARNATDDTTGAHSCGARIAWLLAEMGLAQEEACRRVGNEFPEDCGACNPDACVPALDCGCAATCTDAVLDRIAGPAFDGNYTCRARIGWLMNTQDMNMTAACAAVSAEFPDICGAGCDPETCDSGDDTTTASGVRDYMSATSGAAARLVTASSLSVVAVIVAAAATATTLL